MRVRDTWLLEDFCFDEPVGWTTPPEVKLSLRDEDENEGGFRSLLEDPEACWQSEVV